MLTFWQLVSIGLQHCFVPMNFLFMLFGASLGIVVGALPGLSATTGMVLLLPLTYGLPVEAGMLMLAGVYCGALYGGSISAILMGIPGTAAALPTTFDGYPMAKKGKASEALLLGLYGSSFGGLASSLVLLTLTPFIAKWALKFGPPEIFALGLWGMAVVSSIVGKDPLKGIFMALLGLFISTVGADPLEGYNRLTFDNYYLIGGFGFVPVVLGTLAMPRVFEMIDEIYTTGSGENFFSGSGKRKFFLYPFEILKHWLTLLKSALIGVIIGIAPAAGPTIAAMISYNEAKRACANPDEFGQGHPDGVVAAETANNAATGGSLVLAFSIGIPGSAAAAILLGALIMKGIQPGPMLMRNNPETIFTFFVGFAMVNILVFFIGHFFVQIAYSILRIPVQILAPLILVICFLGAFASENSMFNVYVMLAVGIVAYVLGKMSFPMPPLILALILGPLIEANYWTSILISYGDYFVFFKRPLSAIFMAVALLTFLWPWISALRGKKAKSAT